MKRIIVFVGAALLTSGLPFVHAAAETPQLIELRSCLNAPTQPCIESISATDSAGKTVIARLTGAASGNWDEYQLPGMAFEGSAVDRIIPRAVYRPIGSITCNSAGENCDDRYEELAVAIEPSWLHRTEQEIIGLAIRMPHRASDLLCGTRESPELCYRPNNFDQQVKFRITFQVPGEFRVAVVNAQTSSFKMEQGNAPRDIASRPFNSITIEFLTTMHAQGLFAALQGDPIGTSDYADFMTDQTNVWLIGTRSPVGKDLGACAGIPSIAVIANSIYQSTPVWNPSKQSIEVRLASFHFLPNGKQNVGFFEATISKAMGQCLWGIDLSTKTRAEVSITNSTGESQVATQSSRFDGENYILTAQNFHYSSPLVAFKLTEETEIIPVAMTPTRKSLTCKKGTQRKVVKGANPKCPRGWKRV